MSARIIPADSKYKSIIKLCTICISLCPNPYPILYMAYIPYTIAALDPIAISESILGAPWNNVLKPTL